MLKHRCDSRARAAKRRGDLAELFIDVLAVRLGEDRADDRGHHLLQSLRYHRENVAHDMHPAALPAGAL